MTDSDSFNPFEAPKQPTVSSDPTIGDPIRYEATPTIDDLNSALRPISVIIVNSILLPVLMLGFLFAWKSSIAEEWTSSVRSIAMFGTFIFSVLTALHLISKMFAAKTHLRLNPDATASLTGELTNEGIRLQSQHYVTWHPHCGITFCHLRNKQLVISHDPFGSALKILPTRGFRNADLATRFLESQANTISESLDPAEPLTAPIMIGDQPLGSVAFDGVMKNGDIKTSPLGKIYQRKIRQKLIGRLVLYVVLLPGIAIVSNWLLTLLVGGGIFFLDLRMLRYLLRPKSYAPDPETSLVALQGWLNEGEIALLHNIEQSRSEWQEFRSVGVNEACIWLEPYGVKNRLVLLPRRFFANDAQWQAAVEIVASHSAK